jgi:UDP-3-O-[3-hydroxymyristoyl] glucosamine N-acyltransferase
MSVGQSEYGSVVKHLAVIVTPASVGTTTNLKFGDVLGHDSRKESSGVFAPNLILEERTDIDQTCSISERVVFALVAGVIR